jgi:nitroreductase
LTDEVVADVLRVASLAPSLHNTQPWLFRLAPDRVELHPDPDRRLPATDPEDRELRLSCGAALFNLRLGLRRHGIKPVVSLLPGPEAPGALAVVRRGWTTPFDDETRALWEAVPHRRSNRAPFHERPVPAEHRTALARAAERERSWLHFVLDREERTRFQRLAARAHAIQAADEGVRRELTTWSGDRATADGVPPGSAGLKPAPADEWAMRDFQAAERPPGQEYESDALVAVLCSFYDGPLGELRTGQALQRVLLTATTLGLSVSFLSQAIEVRSVRDEVRRTLGGAVLPQTMLRVGFGSPVPATPRRDVEELLLPSTAHVAS